MEEEGCKYDWCLTIPQIHMAQFFIQYYISVIAFPFCTTLITAVFSCVLGDIPQVKLCLFLLRLSTRGKNTLLKLFGACLLLWWCSFTVSMLALVN